MYKRQVSIQQPLIAPLYEGRSGYELLQALTDSPDTKPYDIVKNYWASQHTGTDFDAWWRRAIHGEALTEHPQKRTLGGKFEVNFRTDPTIYDGRFANNGWLQELPKPITKLTWDNAAIVSPGDAHRLGVESGGMLRLTYEGHTLNCLLYTSRCV